MQDMCLATLGTRLCGRSQRADLVSCTTRGSCVDASLALRRVRQIASCRVSFSPAVCSGVSRRPVQCAPLIAAGDLLHEEGLLAAERERSAREGSRYHGADSEVGACCSSCSSCTTARNQTYGRHMHACMHAQVCRARGPSRPASSPSQVGCQLPASSCAACAVPWTPKPVSTTGALHAARAEDDGARIQTHPFITVTCSLPKPPSQYSISLARAICAGRRQGRVP